MYLLLALLFSFSVMAQVDPRTDKSHACATDFPMHCKDEIPNDENNWSCLGRKMNMLSPKCTEFMKVVYEKQNDCGKDVLTYCNGSKMNYGKWVPCLNERKSSVSKKCAVMLNSIAKKMELRNAVSDTCAAEKKTACKNTPVEACIGTMNQLPAKDLSPACKAKIDELTAAL